MTRKTLAAVASLACSLAAFGCASPAAAPAPVVSPQSVELSTAVPASALACGSAEADARASLFTKPGAVARVEALTGRSYIGARTWSEQPTGARIVLAATPGVTVAWLERVVACQAASDDVLGVAGSRVDVRAVHGGFALDVVAPDRDAARDVQARAEKLAPGG